MAHLPWIQICKVDAGNRTFDTQKLKFDTRKLKLGTQKLRLDTQKLKSHQGKETNVVADVQRQLHLRQVIGCESLAMAHLL